MARFPFRFRGLLMCAIVLTIAWPLHARVWFVNAGATATNDGSSWADAFSDLQTALTVTESGDEIWVAAGTYTPAAPGGDRTATFQLKAGVALYGGFTGSESSRDERDPVANVTTLSGDLNDDDADVADLADLLDEPTRAENSYHVVIASRADETGILDGFTITAGHANGLGSFSNGGGMVNFRGRSTRTQPAGPASPTLVNCTFSRNSALANGGGLYSEGGNPTLTGCTFRGNAAGTGAGMQISGGGSGTLTNCAFSGNTARNSGGGLYSSFGSPTLTNCTFSRNAAGTQGGGGMVNEGSNPTLINCVFIGNVTTGIDRPAGGGMFNRQGSSPILINCTFIANVAEFGGGVFGVENASTMTNCTFSGNVATLGGGIFAWTNSRPTVTNCIFWGDRDDIFGGAVVNYSCVQGGWFGAGGIGIIDADPRFMREPDDGGDGWGVGGNDDFGDLRLRVGSPCIDSGDNSAVLDGVTTDADRNPRIVDDPTRTDTGNGVAPIVDIGAYEYQGDCNGNGSPDDEDIASRVSRDCNGNRVPDECEPPSLPNCGLCMQYLANNTDPGIGGEWTQPGFDDSIWNEGTFGVGYGAGGMVNTTVATGTRSVYTRATFQIGGDPLAVVENVFLGLDYDDGVVAWINGVEVFRADMPVGMPQWNTPANSHESSNSSTCAAQRPQVDVDITDAARPLLVSGTNILAIGVWNRSSDSSDLALIPRLEFNRPPITVMRGPYLQMGTDTSIVRTVANEWPDHWPGTLRNRPGQFDLRGRRRHGNDGA